MRIFALFDYRWPISSLSYTKAWWHVTTAFAVALVLGPGTLDILRLLTRPLAVFILGLTISASLAPVVTWLERWMPRTLATLLVYLILVTALGGLLWWIIPVLIDQIDGSERSLSGSDLPSWSMDRELAGQLRGRYISKHLARVTRSGYAD